MSSTIKRPQVAALGAGYWGRNLVRDLHSLGALKIVVDPDPAVRIVLSETYPGLQTVSNLTSALRDSEIQAVVIATPAPTHADLTIKALTSGRDVLVEKPLALSVAEGMAMVEVAQKQKRLLMVDHLLNRHPAFLAIKQLVKEAKLGQIYRLISRRHNFGKLRKDENVLWSFAPHDVAMILGLLGRLPTRVLATGASYLTKGLEDAVEGTLDFCGTVSAHLSVSWLSPIKEQRLVVVGSEQMAVFDDIAPWEKKLSLFQHKVEWHGLQPEAKKDEQGTIVNLSKCEPLKEQCLTFLDCVEKRTLPPDSDGTEALDVLKVLLALDNSLKSGNWVSLN
jgi:UDP-2-acetamido-3-amino-2,3-dideoxy-glucuronate N-acetyltransferase